MESSLSPESADFSSSFSSSCFNTYSLVVWCPATAFAPVAKSSPYAGAVKDPAAPSSTGLARPSASNCFFIFFRSFFFYCLLMPVVSIFARSVVFFGWFDPAKSVPSFVTSCVLTVLFIVEIWPRSIISCNSCFVRLTITFSGLRSVWMIRHILCR